MLPTQPPQDTRPQPLTAPAQSPENERVETAAKVAALVTTLVDG